MESPPQKSRAGIFKATARPMKDRIREGRRTHREDKIPQPRAREEKKRQDRETRKMISMAVATRPGADCAFSYACRHGTRCRGRHPDIEKLLFKQRDSKVAALEREARCVLPRRGQRLQSHLQRTDSNAQGRED